MNEQIKNNLIYLISYLSSRNVHEKVSQYCGNKILMTIKNDKSDYRSLKSTRRNGKVFG